MKGAKHANRERKTEREREREKYIDSYRELVAVAENCVLVTSPLRLADVDGGNEEKRPSKKEKETEKERKKETVVYEREGRE